MGIITIGMSTVPMKRLLELQIGKPIKVLQSTENDLAIKGLKVSWVEIEYQNNLGTITTGYLW